MVNIDHYIRLSIDNVCKNDLPAASFLVKKPQSHPTFPFTSRNIPTIRRLAASSNRPKTP